MNIFQWTKKLFKTADNNSSSQTQPQSFSGLQCQVRVVVEKGNDRYSWRWQLVSPKRITQGQQSQLDILVSRYCLENYGSSPEGTNAKRLHDDLVAITVLN
jgi:hypothetical protein